MYKIRFLLFILIASLCLCACGPSNSIYLRPIKINKAEIIPAPSSTKITLVRFKDDRGQDESIVGIRRDGTAFLTSGMPSDWVSRATADALTAKGFQVVYADSPSEIQRRQSKYTLTGKIEKLEVSEDSRITFISKISVKYALMSNGRAIAVETLSAEQKRTGIPTNNAVEGLLMDTLIDIAVPLSEKVQRTLGQREPADTY